MASSSTASRHGSEEVKDFLKEINRLRSVNMDITKRWMDSKRGQKEAEERMRELQLKAVEANRQRRHERRMRKEAELELAKSQKEHAEVLDELGAVEADLARSEREREEARDALRSTHAELARSRDRVHNLLQKVTAILRTRRAQVDVD
ncbi:hypothetical protein AAF712_015510 [Marasmius tenuissimus]|uniref:Uncharacterized protein n=1 Tax=Marasmius tenuissimus TaxID=585030 RepID=A0ABR2Z919_9AGAR